MTKAQREERKANESKRLLEKITTEAHQTAREQAACQTCAAGKFCLRHS